MRKIKTTIEINGQRYDATTGALVDAGQSQPQRTVATHAKAVHRVSVTTPQAPVHKITVKKTTPDIKRQPAEHAKAHQPSSAKTLMRRAVHKPGTPLKRHTKAHGPSEVMAKPSAALKLSKSVYRTDERRLSQAKLAKQSEAIRHFTPATAQPGSLIQPAHQMAALRPAAPVAQQKTTADLLEKALQHATGHHEADQPQKRSRRTGFAVAGVAALLLIAVVGSQSITPLRMQMASSRAGFEAVLPSYKPAGFTMNKLHYGPGEVAANFQSNSNDTSYTLIQQQTTLDSQGLLETVVEPADKDYRMVSENGRTLYLYGQRTIAWINDGKLYQIIDQDSLGDPQLIAVANSL